MSSRRSSSMIIPMGAVIIAAAGVAVALHLQHVKLRNDASAYWSHRMEMSADATLSSVSQWLVERQEDDRLLARQAARSTALDWSEGAQSTTDANLADLISNVAAERGYLGIWLLHADGTTIVQSQLADSLVSAVRTAAALSVTSGKNGVVGPFANGDGEILVVIEPVMREDRVSHKLTRLGTMVVGIDPYESLYPMVLREQGGIETARHRLVQHVGENFVVLSPSKFPVAGPGEIRIPWAGAPTVGRYAASGLDTAGMMVGLSGQRVIAATRHLPESGWGIIRALEEREAFAVAEREFLHDEVFAWVLFLACVAAGFAIRRRQMHNRLAAVANAETRYRLLADHATDLIIRRNLEGDVLYVSPSSQQMLGYGQAAFMTQNPLRFVHPDDVEIARVAELVSFRSPLSLPVQYRVRRADGSYAWLETTGEPVKDPQTHELTEIVTVSRDISVRRANEEERTRLAQRNALLLESAAEGIVGLDGDGAIVFVNPAGARLLGWTEADLLGKSQHAILHHTRPDGTPNPRESCGICLTSITGRGQTSQDEVFWRQDGTSFPVEYQSTPVRESEGVVGTVVTFRDVGARRRANQELVRAKEEAEAANAAKSSFLARMSHELRTPLNSVIGFSNVLRKNKLGNLKPLDLSYLERIGSNGVQLLALINDILDLSKIEAGKVTVELSQIEIGALVRDTLVQLDDRTHKNGVSVDSVIPDVMREIETDSAKLRQVLINLIGNAIKFTQVGTVTVSVDVDSITKRPLRVRVTDTGIGIAPERLSAVFAAFEQADTSTTREYGGTGLGLSISRALCELLGFRLEVDSVLGEGSTFTIELLASNGPLASGDSAFAQLARPPQAEFALHADDNSPLVLVIEDDADARELLRGHVVELGYRVAMAASGADGLRMTEELHPDLITLDLMMPGMDGWELLKRLAVKPELARIPVIIVSSIAGEMRDSFVGAVDWIDKPFAQGLLKDAINKNIDRESGGVLIVEDDPDTRELLKRYVSDDLSGTLRVANNGASALAMLEHHLPDFVVLDLQMPYVDGFSFLESVRRDPRLCDLPVIVVTVMHLTAEQRQLLAECTIAVLEKGATLEADLARVLRRAPRPGEPELIGA